jgi:hypothetical protein
MNKGKSLSMYLSCCIVITLTSLSNLTAQKKMSITVSRDDLHQQVLITAGGKPFANFIFPDTLEKPVLYPIYAPDGQLVTRGFPLASRPGEPTDHPHHIGLWFTYENVNGLDFWNNSYAIPAEKKNMYGWIKLRKITKTESGRNAMLGYSANWVNQKNHVLLKEYTDFIFSANASERIIDRITTLTAVEAVKFTDAKDGLLAIRVTHELELPSAQPKEFKDDKGNITRVDPTADGAANGNYLTSEGKTGDSAWSTRASWCMMYGKKNKDTLSVVIIDHPKNPGYPTFWHARGYGLFSANPLGQKIFSNGKLEMNYQLAKGQSVTFRYRIVVGSGEKRISEKRIGELEKEFTAGKN